VVIGRGSVQGKFGRLRTHAHGIVRQSPCPALSVQLVSDSIARVLR